MLSFHFGLHSSHLLLLYLINLSSLLRRQPSFQSSHFFLIVRFNNRLRLFWCTSNFPLCRSCFLTRIFTELGLFFKFLHQVFLAVLISLLCTLYFLALFFFSSKVFISCLCQVVLTLKLLNFLKNWIDSKTFTDYLAIEFSSS